MRALLWFAPLSLAALPGCGFVTGSAVGVLFSDEGDLGLEDPTNVGGFWAGTGVVCLGSSNPTIAPDAGLYNVSGRVVSEETVLDGSSTDALGNLVACDGEPGRVMTIEATNGDIYQLGYAWRDPSGYDMTPMPNVEIGRAVDVTVRQGATVGSGSAGMAVFAGDGTLVYALDAGRGEPGLADGDIDGLRVRADREISRMEDESCGMRVSLALDFSSTEGTLTLLEGEDSSMEIGDDFFVTCSIASHQIEDCEEDVGEVSWVMFR